MFTHSSTISNKTGFLLVCLLFLSVLAPLPVAAQDSLILSVDWSPDGQKIATGHADSVVRIWDAYTGNLLNTLQGHSEGVYDVAWSPNSLMLVSGSSDGFAMIWDINTGMPIQTIEPLGADIRFPVLHVDWSEDGTLIAMGTENNSVSRWNVQTGQLGGNYGHDHMTTPITAITINPITNRVASSDYEGSLIITGSPFINIEMFPETTFLSLDWSPDGTILAAGTAGGMVQLRDSESGEILTELGDTTSAITSIAWSPNGQRIATGERGIIRIWDLTLEQVVGIIEVSDGDRYVETLSWNPAGTQLGYHSGGDSEFEVDTPKEFPYAIAGPDQTIPDMDSSGTEPVTLDGSGSSDPDGTIVAYSWMDETGTEIATGPTPTADLPVGVHTITLTVTDDDGLTASDEVVITVTSATGCVPPVTFVTLRAV